MRTRTLHGVVKVKNAPEFKKPVEEKAPPIVRSTVVDEGPPKPKATLRVELTPVKAIALAAKANTQGLTEVELFKPHAGSRFEHGWLSGTTTAQVLDFILGPITVYSVKISGDEDVIRRLAPKGATITTQKAPATNG